MAIGLLLAMGVGVGLLAALLGIGGGLIMVPVLNLMGATPLQAVATSLVGVCLSSIAATWQNWQNQHLNGRAVFLLALPSLFTTPAGVRCAILLPQNYLLIAFALLLGGAIYLIDLKKSLSPTQATPKQKLAIKQLIATQGIGGIAGFLSGLLGVGGGIVMVPLQMIFLGEDIKSAVRTSLGAITLIALWGLSRHALAGNVLWQEGLLLGGGGLLGGILGAKLLPKIPEKWVIRLFRGLLSCLALYMITKALFS